MSIAPRMSVVEINQAAADVVKNFVILEPAMPTPILAAKLVEELDPELSRELSRALMVGHFEKLIRQERRKPAERVPELALFEHLPLRIIGERDERVSLENATYSDVRRYCKRLGRRHRDRKKNDLRLKEAEELLKRMRAASKKKRGVTVGEVLGIERNHPGKGI